MRKQTVLNKFILVLLSLNFSACSSLGKSLSSWLVTEPKIMLSGLEVEKANLSKVNLKVKVLIDNPNSFSLSLDDMTYSLKEEKTFLASGHFKKKTTIEASSKTDLTLPVELNLKSILPRLLKMSLKKEKSLTVTWNATAKFSLPLFSFILISVPFTGTSKLNNPFLS